MNPPVVLEIIITRPLQEEGSGLYSAYFSSVVKSIQKNQKRGTVSEPDFKISKTSSLVYQTRTRQHPPLNICQVRTSSEG